MAKINRNLSPVSDLTEDEQDEMDANPYAAPEMKRGAVTRPAAIGTGWGSSGEERREVVKAPYIDFKASSTKIVKILEGQPTARWKQHYIPSQRPPFRYCLQEDCPLCDAGVKSSWNFLLSVVEMNDNTHEVRRWTFSWPVAEALKGFSDILDINDSERYFQLKHVKGTGIQVIPLKARDLYEDYGVEPLTHEEISLLSETSYGEETIFTNTYDQLVAIARELKDTDFPKGHERNP
jgi:hypothetical protein